MADEKNNVSIDPKDVERAKAMAELFEKIEEVVDRTRGITKKKRELAEQEKRYTEETLDLTKRIETRKQKILQLEGSLVKELGVYQKIQKNIAENEYKLQVSNERSGIIKDQIKLQQELLAQKEKQYQQEIASGRVTDRTKFARLRELASIKDIIKAKEQEGKKEEYIQSILNKKIAGGLIAASKQKILVDQIEHELNLEKVGLSNDEQTLKLLRNQREEQIKIHNIKQNISRIGEFIERNILSQSEGYGKMKSLVTDVAKGGLTAWLAVIKASVDRWKELDKAAGEFRNKTGFLVTQTYQLDKAVREVNVSLENVGVSIGAAYEAAGALTEQFQVVGLVTKDMISKTAQMAANLGIAVADSAKFRGLFTSIAKTSGTTADTLMESAAALAEMGGVAPSAVMKDMAEASADTLAFLAKSPMALMKATVEARRLGTTVNSLSKSARGFLNYQDSITSELEASALVGKSLNFQEARAAAYAGDVVKSRELALKQLEKAGDFTKLNVYQQEALAKAAGMTVDEVIKQQNQQKMLAEFRAKATGKDKEMLDKYEAMQKQIAENEKDAAKNLAARGAEMVRQQLRQTEMNKLTNALDAIWTDISDSLLAIANNIMPPIIVVARLLGGIFKIIAGLIRGFLAPLDKVGAFFRSGAEGGLNMEKVLTGISKGFEFTGEVVAKVTETVFNLFTPFAMIFAMVGKFEKIMKPFEFIKDIFTSLGDKIFNFADKLKGISKVFSPILKGFSGIIKFVGVFAKFLGPIGLIINAVQVLWELGKSLFSIWTDDNLSIGDKIIASLVAVPKVLWNTLIQPIIDGVAWILNKIWPGMGDGLIDGIKSIGTTLYDTLIQPFVDGYNWIKEKLMGSSPSEIGLGIVDGIKSIGGMLLDALTLPFRTVVNFISKIFGGDGSIGDSIVNGIKNVMGGIFDILTSPFKSAFEFIKKIPLIGKLFGQGDATATVNNEVKSTVENQVAMAVEVKNINELKETVDKLTEAISKLGGTAGGASPVVNVNNNQNAMIEKLDELIGLLKDGAIAVNMDGILVSRTLAKTS